MDLRKMNEQEIENYLMSLWCQQLKLDSVALSDDFLKIGGKSIDLFRMLTRIEADFNQDFDFDNFFEDTRLESLKNILSKIK